MNIEVAQAHVSSILREAAELRLKIAEECTAKIIEAAGLMSDCLRLGGKILFFGNGGSAADAQHLAAELVGCFATERAALPALALTTDSSILTAVGNDYGFNQIFVRQIEALGREGDIAIAISTSGDSANVLAAAACARSRRLKTIALTGNCGDALARNVDVAIVISSRNTARIQECDITIGHLLCELLETDLLDTQLKTKKCSVNRSSLASDAE